MTANHTLPRGNYHTHTHLCKHADGEPIEYAATAILHGLKTLGFSDHTPHPDARWNTVRMAMEELPRYITAIDRARDAFPALRIFTGLECEYDPALRHFYADELLQQYRIDYLVFAPHWFPHRSDWTDCFRDKLTPAHLQAYARHTTEALSTGLFTFMAHPDLYGNNYLTWDANAAACARDICAAAARFNVPLEINGLGFRRKPLQTPQGQRPPYPWKPFWEIAAEYDILVTPNSDAHTPRDIVANLADATQLARDCRLTLVDLESRITDAGNKRAENP